MNFVKNPHGFSLIETVMATAISLSVLMLGVEFLIYSKRHSKRLEIRQELYRESELLLDYLSSSIRGLGGGAIPPWAAIWIEDDCGTRGPLPGCDGTDRVSLVRLDDTLAECKIVGFSGANRLLIDDSSGCCLTGAFVSRQAIINRHSFHHQIFLTDLHDSVGDCHVNYDPGQATSR